jgi:predicted transposase/invertase (TIGR01784 family)
MKWRKPVMRESADRYINIFTDYGFKKIFGEKPNSVLLQDFLTELLRSECGEIRNLTYLQNEHLGDGPLNRDAIFDLYCENDQGKKFIVELQKSKQKFFKDRTVYYSTFPIREQVKKGNWDFELQAVYTIGILDFVFDSDQDEPDKYRYDVKLTDIETKEIFYDKLTFIYLEMPKFQKSLEECETRFEKWMYALRNLNRLNRVPENLREEIFLRLFETAEIARFTPAEMMSYECSLKHYRDLNNVIETGREEGIIEGKKQEKYDIARRFLALGMSLETVAEGTGLDISEIQNIVL